MNGRMLPIAMVDCENCKLSSVVLDTRVPQITQVEVLKNENGYITYRVAPWANYKIVDGRFVAYGSNWELTPSAGIAFEGETGRLVYRTSDIGVGVYNVEEVEQGVIRAPWNDARLLPVHAWLCVHTIAPHRESSSPSARIQASKMFGYIMPRVWAFGAKQREYRARLLQCGSPRGRRPLFLHSRPMQRTFRVARG